MKIIFITPVYNDWDSIKILSQDLKKISDANFWEANIAPQQTQNYDP